MRRCLGGLAAPPTKDPDRGAAVPPVKEGNMKSFDVRTGSRTEMVDITSQVRKAAEEAGIENGICHVYVAHTTAGVTINENADPAVTRDILMELNKQIPFENGYTHTEGNSAAHIKASLMGSSAAVPLEGGVLQLGTWQGIYFCEFDGPRRRKVLVTVTGSNG